MNHVTRYTATLVTVAICVGAAGASAADSAFDTELANIEHEFDVANFQTTDKHERKAAFDALLKHTETFGSKYSTRAEALAWEGIVLSTYAGEVGAMGAMKYAKAARESLHEAERLDPTALDGGLYASLGALYSKVPGGFIGFGNDALAAEYFAKALDVDPDNIDSNYFYGEFLIDQGDLTAAASVLERALDAPTNPNRPLLDAGRRDQIRALLAITARVGAN